jgi:hypothetical protein
VFELALATGATFTADECAAVAGCLPKSWLSMVTRRCAPPSRGFSPETGERVWDVDEVMKWQIARPGRGNWARDRNRNLCYAHLRARLYSFGGDPAWKPQRDVFSDKKVIRPRLPFIPA